MNWLVLPLALALALAGAATSAHRRLPPRLAARFVTAALVLVVGAAVPTAVVIALAYLAHVPVVGLGFEWCARAMGLHSAVPAWLGLPVVVLVVVGTVRTVSLLRRHRSLRLRLARPVHLAHSHTPYAVTLPGPAGQIVVSTAMMDMLDEDERSIVIAHEAAHARYRHDRYLLAAELAAAALPPLRAMSRRVSFSVERWADDVAARACGDRRQVAITLGKVALQANPATVAGFAGLGVASRMAALLGPEVRAPHRRHLVALWSSLAAIAAFSAYQLHHLERLLPVLCPH